MHQFHHNYVLKKIDNVKLLFTDTDSLVYEIKDGNVYDQCFKDKHLFDFRGYSEILFIMMIQIKKCWVK